LSRKLFALSEQQESPNQKTTTMPNFLLFLATSIAITVAPGPDNLQVLARGISQGRAAGLVAALGFAAGITFHTTLAALGVAALLRSSPLAFEAIKLAGAAYLVWIGIKALRSQGLASAHERAPQPLSMVFRQSVLGNLMNPKVTLFFVVFLPQFVQPHGAQSVTVQMLELGALFMLQTVVVFSLFGVCAGIIGGWLRRRPRVGLWLDRVAGATFIAIGIRVALRD
jgi:threonine/homoserine/homoserine lactone efflux protein